MVIPVQFCFDFYSVFPVFHDTVVFEELDEVSAYNASVLEVTMDRGGSVVPVGHRYS